MKKTTFETFPLVIPGMTLDEAKPILLLGLQRRVRIGPVWLGGTADPASAPKVQPSPEHTIDPDLINWSTYTHGGVTNLQAEYEWEE